MSICRRCNGHGRVVNGNFSYRCPGCRGTGQSKTERNRFQKGSGCYNCAVCGKRTRSTGNGDNENLMQCEKCYEEGGLINEHSDSGGQHHGYEGKGGRCPECPSCREIMEEESNAAYVQGLA